MSPQGRLESLCEFRSPLARVRVSGGVVVKETTAGEIPLLPVQ